MITVFSGLFNIYAIILFLLSNGILKVSGEKDGIVRFWDFQSTDLMCEFRVPSPIVHFRMNECNSLLAVAVGVGAIGIIDVLCKRVVRIINNAHKGNITAIEFSFDGRWLLSASDDCLLKVSSQIINIVHFPL